MKKQILGIVVVLLFIGYSESYSQCATWNGSPRIDDAKNAHSIYRQAMKINDFKLAFDNWQIAYDIAPAADGKRDYHFIDGAALYKQKFEQATDAAKKAEFVEKAMALYDQAIECYQSGAIPVKCNSGDCVKQKVGYLEGRKAFDMFYTFNTPYSKTLAALKAAVEHSGNATEYIVLAPYAQVVVHQFTNDLMDKETARAVHTQLNEIADHNIANNAKFGTYYDQAKASMNGSFAYIERQIFDCGYFVEKLRPDYEADPDNMENIKNIVAILKGQGCEPGEPFYDELDAKWKEYAAEENARIQAEFEANNPNIMAKKLYDEGDFAGAEAKYLEAIEQEADNEKKASYLFSLASIQFRKMDKYTAARKTALDAAAAKPNWGRPYMLIGDMYGRSARSCGDSWNQRLAILAAMDKYSYAKSIDPEVAEEANERLSRYRESMPSQDEGFMRGIKSGQTVQIEGCWIGETVRVRYN
jgi:tetratricopeptide (TPR) repeat protein